MEGQPKITVCENGVVIIEHPVKKNDYLEDGNDYLEDGDEQ